MEFDAELATTASFSLSSMATLTGPDGVPVGQGSASPDPANVQMLAITAGGPEAGAKLIKLISFEPVLATTATPVLGLMATALGDVPTLRFASNETDDPPL
jgi:hypothetical protein